MGALFRLWGMSAHADALPIAGASRPPYDPSGMPRYRSFCFVLSFPCVRRPNCPGRCFT